MSTLQDVRLKPWEIEAICAAFRAHFPPEDHLWIFGSRVSPKARGGDIDLYIETTITDVSTIYENEKGFVFDLYDKIGEQKIDVVLHLLTSNFHLAIYDVARKEGVQLV